MAQSTCKTESKEGLEAEFGVQPLPMATLDVLAVSDFYVILGVDREATPEEIRAAYKMRSLEHHPDKNAGDSQATQRFQVIQEAFATLSDEQKRERYDSMVGALATIKEGLEAYAKRPNPEAFIKVYDAVFKESQEDAAPLHRAFLAEVANCAQALSASVPERGTQSPSEYLEKVLLRWRQIRSRLYALEKGFAHLARYFCKQNLAGSLADAIVSAFRSAGLDDPVPQQWRDVAIAISELKANNLDGLEARIRFNLVPDIVMAWCRLGPPTLPLRPLRSLAPIASSSMPVAWRCHRVSFMAERLARPEGPGVTLRAHLVTHVLCCAGRSMTATMGRQLFSLRNSDVVVFVVDYLSPEDLSKVHCARSGALRPACASDGVAVPVVQCTTKMHL